MQIRQDAEIYFGKLSSGRSLAAPLGPDRHGWVHVIKGKVRLLGESLSEGDSAAISNAATFDMAAEAESEFLVFSLA